MAKYMNSNDVIYIIERECRGCAGDCSSCKTSETIAAIRAAEGVSVQSASETHDSVEAALTYLNDVSHLMPYEVYSTLFDKIAEIYHGDDIK